MLTCRLPGSLTVHFSGTTVITPGGPEDTFSDSLPFEREEGDIETQPKRQRKASRQSPLRSKPQRRSRTEQRQRPEVSEDREISEMKLSDDDMIELPDSRTKTEEVNNQKVIVSTESLPLSATPEPLDPDALAEVSFSLLLS